MNKLKKLKRILYSDRGERYWLSFMGDKIYDALDDNKEIMVFKKNQFNSFYYAAVSGNDLVFESKRQLNFIVNQLNDDFILYNNVLIDYVLKSDTKKKANTLDNYA